MIKVPRSQKQRNQKVPIRIFQRDGLETGKIDEKSRREDGGTEREGEQRSRDYQGRGLRQEKESAAGGQRPERRMEGVGFQSTGGEEKARRGEP